MVLQKVTAFVTRETDAGRQLLLLRHPFAGVQLPAGTVEIGEGVKTAVVREVREETGLSAVRVQQPLVVLDENRPDGEYVVVRETAVYARPDPNSFDWATLRRGIAVTHERAQGDFVQVTYREWDDVEQPVYVTYQITGWVPQAALTRTVQRHLFHLTTAAETPDRWQQDSDNHTFTCFWAGIDALPPLVAPQQRWLAAVVAGGL